MGKLQVSQALQIAGNQHKYQHILIFIISLTWVLINFVILGSTYIYTNPTFKCLGQEQRHFLESQACKMLDKCEISQYIIWFLVDKFTLTSELQLYCQQSPTRNLIQGIFSVGSLFGIILINLISDIKGRRYATILTLIITVIANIFTLIGGYFHYTYFIIASQFLCGFGATPLISLAYTFLTDFCGDNLKPVAVILVNFAWSVTTVIMGILYLLQLSWFTYILYVIIFPILIATFLVFKYVYQSPYILLNRNKKTQALNVLQKISLINKMPRSNIQKIQLIIKNQKKRSQNQQASFSNVFKIIKKWLYLKPIIILSILRACGTLIFYGTSYSFSSQGLGLGVNSILAGFCQLIAFAFLSYFSLYTAYYINTIPRKKGISGFYFLVFIMGMLFFIPSIKFYSTLETGLMGIGRLFSTMSYTLTASLQTQCFTVQIQSTAVGITQCFGLMGMLLGPLLVNIADGLGIDPVGFISLFVSFGIWTPFFLEETLKQTKKEESTQKKELLPRTEYDQTVQQNSSKSQAASQDVISLDFEKQF